ncbi:fructose-bisphosphate aldolase class I [soil metagenome]
MDSLQEIAKQLVAPGKGILAADESLGTIEKRFLTINLQSNHETRLAYRKMLFDTPGVEEYISGIIMFDETLRDKVLTNPNIIAGIKVDEGMKDMPGFPGDKLTDGLIGLNERLIEYKALGAKFAKWRAAFLISEVNPSIQSVEGNAERLAEYALLCQQNGIVPIVEPEILMDGNHTIDRCYEVTRSVLKIVFIKLKDKKVDLSAILLKPNMILPGVESDKTTSDVIAQKTLEVLNDCVDQIVPGIVFLSGGQTEEEATDNLREINKVGGKWELSFSFGRALQNSALKTWNGKNENVANAQQVFLARAKMNSLARYGK